MNRIARHHCALRGKEWGESARTANPVQTTGFFVVKKGFFGYAVDAGNPLRSWRGLRGAGHSRYGHSIAERTETLPLFFDTKVEERNVPLGRQGPLRTERG